jgi:hypothetical protein
MVLLEGVSFSLNSKVRDFSLRQRFFLRTPRERYIRIFRYPGTTKIVNTMTFSADHSQGFLFQSTWHSGEALWVMEGISDRDCLVIPLRPQYRLTPAACSPCYTFYNGLYWRFWFSLFGSLYGSVFDRYAALRLHPASGVPPD